MNYNQRKDHRSDEEFAKHISDSTKKELYLAHRWQLEMQLQGKKYSLFPFGLDVTGEINRSTQDGKPDFKWYTYKDGTFLLEVKNSPVMNKVTFKVNAMKNIIKWESYTLLFINTGQETKHSIQEMDLSKAFWTLFDHHIMQNILSDYQDKIFKWKPFGNKDCIKIVEKDFGKYFDLEPFRFEL